MKIVVLGAVGAGLGAGASAAAGSAAVGAAGAVPSVSCPFLLL